MKHMTQRVLLLVAGMALLAGADRVFAHHSFAATYDSSERIEIEGVVKELVWRNPHSFLRIEVTEKDGATKTWVLEWGSISALVRSQLTRTTLKPGDRLLIVGAPARDRSSLRLLAQSLKRPADGWEWQGRVE